MDRKRLIKRADIIVFGIILPIVAVVSVLFIVFSSPNLDLGGGYMLMKGGDDGSKIRVRGRNVIGGDDIHVWGRYPHLYGYGESESFLINIETGEERLFKRDSVEYLQELEKLGLDPERPASYSDFYSDRSVSKKNIRKLFRMEMSRPSDKIKLKIFRFGKSSSDAG